MYLIKLTFILRQINNGDDIYDDDKEGDDKSGDGDGDDDPI